MWVLATWTCNRGALAPKTSPAFDPFLKAMKGINFLSDLLDSFNTDLVEAGGWVTLGEHSEDGADSADHPARATPRSQKSRMLILSSLIR